MKKKSINLLSLIFALNISLSVSQTIDNKNVNDTLTIDKIGKKIELESNLELCEKWNETILSICKKRKDLENINLKVKQYYASAYLTALISKAYFEEEKGNLKKSIAINLSVLKFADKKKDKKILGFVNSAIGTSFAQLEEYESAKKYYLEAIKFLILVEDKTILATLYGNLAYTLKNSNDLKTSINYSKKSLEIWKKLNNNTGIANCLMFIGRNYYEQNDFLKAEKYYLSSVTFFSKTSESEAAESFLNLAYIKNALHHKKSELKYLLKAYELSNKFKKITIISVSSKQLYKFYKSLNQPKKALFYYEKSIETDKSINKDENKNELLKAEFKYETQKKQSQIQTLSQQKKIATLESQRQKTIVLVLGILMVLLATISYFLFNRYKTKKQTELLKIKLSEAQKTIKAEKQAAESELKALKSQMNPHFIFNALSSIQHQFMYGDKNLANEQMGNFTYLTRQILNVSGLKQILITTEIEILTKYLELEKMRFETNFEYEITLSGNLDPDYHELPPMLLQPLLENCIKHGLMHLQGLKKLSLNFNLNPTEDVLICTIIDNGIGRQKAGEMNLKNLSNHQSYASQALVQRLNIWNKNIDNPLVYSDILDNNGVVCGTQVVLMVEVH